MGTRHDQQERDIELNAVTERSKSQSRQDSKNATSSDLNKRIKKTIISYHLIMRMNQLYLFLFTIGVSMDTLFLFIPNINKDKKCVIIENDVKIVALVLRSVTDIFFLERILYKVLVGFGLRKRSWVYYFNMLIDILCIAPLPQIFGSFWYFFAVQLETSCASNMLDCKDTTRKNSTSNFCSVNQTFDFGIYTEAIKADLLVTKDIPRKIIHSFWWGLRNLSSCGQNLQSSGYLWETCFGALITTAGLVLFLYFIGQVQVYIEVLVGPIIKEKWHGMKHREIDVDVWFNNNKIPEKDKIKKTLKQKIRYMPEIKDIHLKILVPLL